MKFPVQKGASTRGLGSRLGQCSVCHKKGVGEPYTFAWLNGIAHGTDPKATVSLSIGVHGRHDAGHDELGGNVHIVQDAAYGQFEYYFCSTKCLRRFFGMCVDELEAKVRLDRKHKRPNKALQRTRSKQRASER